MSLSSNSLSRKRKRDETETQTKELEPAHKRRKITHTSTTPSKHNFVSNEDINDQKNEEQFGTDKLEISHKQNQTEEGKEKERLMHDGAYSLALPIIACNRHKFDPQRTINIIANALKQFMSIHRHPKLRIIVIATAEYRDALHRALKAQYEMSVSLEDSLEFAEDANKSKSEAFE
eukprot:13215_1